MSSETQPPFDAHICRNRSPAPSPLPTPANRQPTLHVISYDSITIPTTPPTLQYDLQSTTDPPRHIRALPALGLSKSTRLELLAEPHYASQLLKAEKEICDTMKLLQDTSAFHARSTSSSSGEVIDVWVEGLEADCMDGVSSQAVINLSTNEFGVDYGPAQLQQYLESDENSIFGGGEAGMPILRVGCSCANGCYKSVAFAEELAGKEWPGDWVVRVEHRNLMPKVHRNVDWRGRLE